MGSVVLLHKKSKIVELGTEVNFFLCIIFPFNVLFAPKRRILWLKFTTLFMLKHSVICYDGIPNSTQKFYVNKLK